MTIAVPADNAAASTPEYSGAEFGISADGFPVGRIGEITLAMLPASRRAAGFWEARGVSAVRFVS